MNEKATFSYPEKVAFCCLRVMQPVKGILDLHEDRELQYQVSTMAEPRFFINQYCQ